MYLGTFHKRHWQIFPDFWHPPPQRRQFLVLPVGNFEQFFTLSSPSQLPTLFQKELLQKYPQDLFLFEFFGELFKWIPVAHLINDKIFVIHGGLPDQPDLKIEDIRQKKYAQL